LLRAQRFNVNVLHMAGLNHAFYFGIILQKTQSVS